jgi:tetratricopeptide (TPR) repeat protein
MKESLNFIPTDTVYLNIDKEAVLRSGMLIQGDSLMTHEDSLNSIPDRMAISLADVGALDKSKLMMLEMLANANWERPLYVAMTVGSDNYFNLGNHFVQEGLAYRITPFTTNIDGRSVPGMTSFDTEKTYDNVMNRFKFGGVSAEGVYLDETVMRMCLTHRMLLVDLASHLMDEGKDEKALKVLERLDKELPEYNVPYDMDSREVDGRRLGYQDGKSAIYSSGSSYREALLYVELDKEDKARPILDKLWKRANQYLDYYLTVPGFDNISCLKQFSVMANIIRAYYSFDENKARTLSDQVQRRCEEFVRKGGDLDRAHWQL